jgi:hypothetical protein
VRCLFSMLLPTHTSQTSQARTSLLRTGALLLGLLSGGALQIYGLSQLALALIALGGPSDNLKGIIPFFEVVLGTMFLFPGVLLFAGCLFLGNVRRSRVAILLMASGILMLVGWLSPLIAGWNLDVVIVALALAYLGFELRLAIDAVRRSTSPGSQSDTGN